VIDHTTTAGSDDRTGSPISRDSVVAAGLTVITRDGFDQLSVRRLAAEKHYSASAIAYCVTPMARYVSSLWATIYDDVIADAMNAAGRAGRDRADPDPWARRTAEIIVCWADREPNLADFYVAPPRLDHMEVDAGHCAVTPAQWAEAGEELGNAWWYFVRRSRPACSSCSPCRVPNASDGSPTRSPRSPGNGTPHGRRSSNGQRRVASTRNSAESTVGVSSEYAPGSTELIESTPSPCAAHTNRNSRGV
jgi:hypothetical protein